MYVLVNGLPYFGKILVNDLNEFGSKRKCIFLNTYYSRWDKLLFFLLLPFTFVLPLVRKLIRFAFLPVPFLYHTIGLKYSQDHG